MASSCDLFRRNDFFGNLARSDLLPNAIVASCKCATFAKKAIKI